MVQYPADPTAFFNKDNMFTLVYIKNQFNRPDNLSNFLESNIGECPMIRIDCISPYQGTEDELIREVCNYLSDVSLHAEVSYCMTQNVSTERSDHGQLVYFLVIQIRVSQKN